MTEGFWLGVAVLPLAAVVVCLIWAVFGAASWAWSKLHRSLIVKVQLKPDPISFEQLDDGDYEDRHTIAANRFRDALVASPKLWVFSGLGFAVCVARESREAPIRRL